ncbi:hypothetical protein RHGRI_020301 [Rhododendron griersonianum]|uniref:Uncharacterized protein n=1 Tax=Rhododendron griersonianum TaxID=479676 RepID=A0AAV6JIN3_9ERIC|nr:hypothetical protein RHGRI_020301 [Rhododendron griersonianum]
MYVYICSTVIQKKERKKLPHHAVVDPELVASHYRCLVLLLNPHRNRFPSAGGKTTNGAQTPSASENNNNETTMTVTDHHQQQITRLERRKRDPGVLYGRRRDGVRVLHDGDGEMRVD